MRPCGREAKLRGAAAKAGGRSAAPASRAAEPMRKLRRRMSALHPRGGGMGFLQLLRTFLAADFDDRAADGDGDGVLVQLVIAGGTGSFAHDVSPWFP